MTRPGEPVPSPVVRPALAVAGVGALAALSLAHPSSSRMLTWPWVLLTALLWLAPAAALIVRLAQRTTLPQPNRFVMAGLALLAVGAVASAASSPFAAPSLARTWPTLGGVALCLLLHDVNRAAAARFVALGSLALVAAMVIAWLDAPATSLWTARNAFPFGHSNYTAGFVVLALPWFAERAWSVRGGARVAWLGACALALVALVSTSSRGGVLALGTVGVVAALVVLVRSRWPRARQLTLAGALLALGALAVLANPRLRDVVLRRGWSDEAQESNRQRAAMLQAGRILGAERPLLGWGPGTVPLAYPGVRARLEGGVDNVLELHDTPLQVWATLGAVGVAAAALLAIGFVASARRTFGQPHATAAAASLGGYAIFALTDHQLDLPAMTAFVAFDVAMLAVARRDNAIAPPANRLWAGLALLLCVAPAIALFRDVRVRRTYDQALTAIGEGRATDALALLDAATRQAPRDPYFQHQAVGVLLALRETVTDAAQRNQFTRDAIARLEASLATGAHEEFAHFNLGWLYLDVGDFAAAARHFSATAHLVPDKGGVYFGLGLALQSAGRTADATRALALEWINDPRSLTSPAWETPALAALRPAVRVEVMRLYADLATRDPRAVVAAAWTRWWLGENVAPAELGRGFTRDAAEFVDALPALAAHRPVAARAAWATLYRAWRERNFSAPELAAPPAVAAALQRRAQRHGDDFGAFLRAGSEDEAALVRTYRRTRTGYGVLALHPDGPALADAFIVQEIAPLADFAATLFPPKGWLPGRFLLALLPPDPR